MAGSNNLSWIWHATTADIVGPATLERAVVLPIRCVLVPGAIPQIAQMAMPRITILVQYLLARGARSEEGLGNQDMHEPVLPAQLDNRIAAVQPGAERLTSAATPDLPTGRDLMARAGWNWTPSNHHLMNLSDVDNYVNI